MGAKGSVEAAKLNADGWGHIERGSRHYGHRHNQRSQSLNRGQALSRADVGGGQAGCASCAMGNKLSCSCAPLMRKAYRYEDSPWQTSRRRDGHLLRLWAEVFHVSASGAGTVKWQQVSEDLVPVNITCIQDSPECVFHITAYNSQVDKILDVRLVQPGTRIGQASECFVYWKDPMTNDTWGLNFTSPIDAKQFRECCSPSFKFSRKASSSYSLKLDPPGKGKIKAKRKPLSTPASPSRVREPQCTCMTNEQYARLRAQDPRYRGSSTLPRATTRGTETEGGRGDKVTAATSSTSLYDNVATSIAAGQTGGLLGQPGGQDTLQRQTKSQETNTMTSVSTLTSSVGTQNHVGSQIGQDENTNQLMGSQSGQQLNVQQQGQQQRMDDGSSKSEGTQAGGTLQQSSTKSTASTGTITRSKDYNDEMSRDPHEMHHNMMSSSSRRNKSKSTEDMNVDPNTLKRMLKPMPSTESPLTSPEMGRRRYNYYNNAINVGHTHQHAMHAAHMMNNMSSTMNRPSSQTSRFSGSRSSHEIGRGYQQRGLYLELERERGCVEGSPPSDNVMFDNQCYATTPSSSNGNSDQDQPYGQRTGGRHMHHHQNQSNITPTPGSPTSRLLLEYEMHLRNTLAKGMDAESYSLHTFEALLSQSMENLELAENLPGSTQRSPYPSRRHSSAGAKSSTLPLPHQRERPMSTRERERDRDRDGYYSDRNELIRERERERERDRGYLSDHNSSFSASRCASCIGESARAQWFRHSDGWRSGSSTLGSGSGQGLINSQSSSGHKRSPWDSLPSLRQDSSLNDSGYKSNRADSLEQRGVFDRQDSLRSDYLSDRETRYGIVQQASIDSTDSRLCYLTSSENSIVNEKTTHQQQQYTSEKTADTTTTTKGSDGTPAAASATATTKTDATTQGSEGTESSTGGQDKNNTLSLHCCCVIVQITPVTPGRGSHVTTTASAKDINSSSSGSGSSGIAAGDEHGIKRKPVCNCHLKSNSTQTLGLVKKQQHCSLDKLLQDDAEEKPPKLVQSQQQQQKQQPPQLPQKPIKHKKFYQQINGDLIEWTGKPCKVIESQHHGSHHQLARHSSGSSGGGGQSKATPVTTPRQHPPLSQKTPSQQQILFDTENMAEILEQLANTTRPVPHPRQLIKNKSADSEYNEFFDRTQQQRHSSRSVEGPCREETIEWLEQQGLHQRHSSGPSELSLLKDDSIADWLMSLTRKQDDKKPNQLAKSGSSKNLIKNELTELFKKPLHRQSSGPSEISVLKSDIFEWLARQQQQQTKQKPKDEFCGKIRSSRKHYQQILPDPTSQIQQNPPQPQPRKRHSLGANDGQPKEQISEWIQYPLQKLSSLPREQHQITSQSSCVDLTKKSRHQKHERRLRHSASEVVTPTVEKNVPPPKPERQFTNRTQTNSKECASILSAQMTTTTTTTTNTNTTTTTTTTTTTATTTITTAGASISTHASQHKHTRSERNRRHQTQRSATVADMTEAKLLVPLHRKQAASGERNRRSSSLPRCTDPQCPFIPVCNDPNCCYPCLEYSCNMLRYKPSAERSTPATGNQIQQQKQQCKDFKCSSLCYEYRCYSLPRCMDSKCRTNEFSVCTKNVIKCNSLPRCAEAYRSNLSRENSRSSLTRSNAKLASSSTALITKSSIERTSKPTSSITPQAPSTSAYHHHQRSKNGGASGGSNGKLTKSVSAVSLNSRRRRHKTVHFGENLLREVCQNRKLIKTSQQPPTSTYKPPVPAPPNEKLPPDQQIAQQQLSHYQQPQPQPQPTGPENFQPNVQLLYNFVEGVLSAWVDEEDDEDDEHVKSGPDSEPERGAILKPMHRCNRARFQTIRRVVTEAAALKGTLKLGNSRYRHRHWRGTAKECNERFLRKISDDDRMSLTTAVSDEDDGESVMASPYKAKATGTAAASFNCTGAVRKAGFLSVKKWLLRKKHQIELARKRGWKGYWVCLKGTTLLFYPCDSREGRSVEAAPKHLIIVDGAIMQPIPEHPKRDYIFCLSTAFGDAYLFQAPCQVELENWVNSIHSACAAAFARHRGKTGTLHLLQEEIFRLEKAIESDHKLKHMAELQQSVVTDQDTRHQIQTQILQWEENLERLHCEQFRLRCYMASLQSGELPNPKSLLTHVSRPTKNTLNKLGVFTVSSFHAFICARSPSLLNNLLAGRGATKRRPPLLSRSNSGSSRRSMQMNSRDDPDKTYKVPLPDNNYATVYLRDAMSVEEFLASACARKNLNPMEHFVRVKKRRDMEDHNYFVPHRNDLIETYLHTHEIVEVCAKILYQVELQRTTLEQMWGFSVEAELIENADRQDELCCYVSRVEDKSVAMQNGIIKGDEIMVINGAIVSDLDMMYLESVLQEEQALCMMMRSSRTEPPDLANIMRVTDDMIDSLVCPPPPSDPPIMSEEMISGLIVPAPGWRHQYIPGKDMYSPEAESSPAPSSADPQIISSMIHAGDRGGGGGPKQNSRTNSFEIENLLKTAEQVTGFCRSPQETRKSSPTGSVASSVSNAMLTPLRQLSDAEKLRKVILELVDTERTYVKHLNNLLEHYLEPLKRETFLSMAEITTLFGNIQEIVTFQRQFLQNLEEALELEPEFHKFEHPSQFKNVLFAIGSAFLYYVNHFKLYSSFCASHSKAQKVLHPNEGNQALQEFLAARNPKQQHSSTLESYLIKPIQRILKYPLLLQQLRNLTDPHAEEHLHLVEALKGMEKVAEHINEMQRIHEEYGAIFDHLFRQHQKSCKQPIDLSPGDLLYYGGVEWLNISDFLGKIKKGLELHAMCFVFKSAVVFLCKERLRQKKKLMGVSSKNAPNEVEIIRYQVLIPVTEVQVRASSAKDMDSHFLWELIHLRSQLQRRSEKVYVLSNSTADFRNAFLKTIRQIIRESVRNMSIPMKGLGSLGQSIGGETRASLSYSATGSSQTLERPKQQITIMQGSQTLGKTKKSKTTQRHSAGNIDYDNLSGSQEADDPPMQHQVGFRTRSKTVGDAADQPPPPPKRGCSQLQMQHDPEKIDSGTKSEGEDDSQHGNIVIKPKATLGRTPNHLTLSTTSTLSVGSTGSQARLIQSSHPPSSYQPVLMKDLGSPVWKPRDMINLGDAQSTSRKDDSNTK